VAAYTRKRLTFQVPNPKMGNFNPLLNVTNGKLMAIFVACIGWKLLVKIKLVRAQLRITGTEQKSAGYR
jgi:hypothetical protein